MLKDGHPVLRISAGTHNLSIINAGDSLPNSGGIYPLLPPAAGLRQGTVSHSNYLLVDFNELWQRRKDIDQNRTFERWGYFDSYYHRDVTAPWLWEYGRLNWLAQPGELVQRIQDARREPVAYLDNPYAGL